MGQSNWLIAGKKKKNWTWEAPQLVGCSLQGVLAQAKNGDPTYLGERCIWMALTWWRVSKVACDITLVDLPKIRKKKSRWSLTCLAIRWRKTLAGPWHVLPLARVRESFTVAALVWAAFYCNPNSGMAAQVTVLKPNLLDFQFPNGFIQFCIIFSTRFVMGFEHRSASSPVIVAVFLSFLFLRGWGFFFPRIWAVY